jgi:hypothetical protein
MNTYCDHALINAHKSKRRFLTSDDERDPRVVLHVRLMLTDENEFMREAERR